MGRFSIQDDEDSNGGENDSEPHLSLAIQSSVENCHENPFQDLPHFRNAEHQNEHRIPNEIDTNDPFYPMQLRSFRNNNEWAHRNVPVERRRWSRHIFVICILIVFQNYLPPPPPPNDTWHDYISNSTESIMSVAVNALALTYYITYGCFVNIRSDIVLHIQHWKQRYKQEGMIQILNNMRNNRNDHASNCSFQCMDLHTIQKYLSNRIVGQHSSIHMIAEAVSRPWQSSNKPLSLLLTGPTGVGKYKTLKLLSHIMLLGNETWNSSTIDDGSCWIDSSPSCQHAILELNGFDYALDYGDGQKNSMVDRILHHIHQQQGNGAVILLKHVEQLSESNRLDLIRLVQSPMVKIQKKDESSIIRKYEQILGFPETFHFKDVELSLQNSIFFLTTDVGTKRIFDAIREGSNHINDIQNRIRQDIKQDLGSYFHMVDYIIPYGPLQFSQMKSALEMEIKHMNCTFQREMRHGVHITEQALHILASPSIVEYIEAPYSLSSSTTKNLDSSFIFAAHGGHGLPVKVIQNIIVKVMRNVSFQGPNEFVRIDVRPDDYILILERCRMKEMSDGNEEFCFDQWEFYINDLMKESKNVEG